MKTGFFYFIGTGLASLIVYQPALAEFHDPMRPPPYALEKFRLEKINNSPVNKAAIHAKKMKPLQLNSILYSSQRKHAIINNKLMKKGDVIRGAKLVSLHPYSVRLISKGKIIDLSLHTGYKSMKKYPNENKK